MTSWMACAVGLALVCGAPAARAEPAPSAGSKPAAAPPVKTTTESAIGLPSRLPHGDWAAHTGHEVGLLFENISPWGSLNLHDVNGAPTFRHEAYAFCREDKSPQGVYFPSNGDGLEYTRKWTAALPDGTKSAPMGVAMLGPGVKNAFGPTAAAHLVRVEVNHGKGSPVGPFFVATDVDILDGKPGTELVVADVLTDARARFDRFATDQHAAIVKELDAARAAEAKAYGTQKAPASPATGFGAHASPIGAKPDFGDEVELVEEAVVPTWSQQDHALSVLFIRRTTHTRSRSFRAMVVHSCPPGAPCMPPHEESQHEQRRFSILLGYGVTFDHAGTVIAEHRFRPTREP